MYVAAKKTWLYLDVFDQNEVLFFDLHDPTSLNIINVQYTIGWTITQTMHAKNTSNALQVKDDSFKTYKNDL